MIDVGKEQLISLKQAAETVPGGPVNVATTWRWALAGKLESIRVGGRRFTSNEAVHRMIAASNRRGTVAASATRSAQVDRAERELERAGI